MKYPAYSKYKDSGVQWLGEVPEHWGVKRGRFNMYVNPASLQLRSLSPESEVSFVPMEATYVMQSLTARIVRLSILMMENIWLSAPLT